MSIILEGTYLCCGAYMICNFGYENEAAEPPESRTINEIREGVKDKLDKVKNRAIVYTFLNPNQKKYFDKLLKELKFRPVAIGYNKPYKTDITMYVYTNKRPIEGGTNG